MNTDEHQTDTTLDTLIGLQNQVKLVLQGLSNGGGILLMGCAGTGKTLLIKTMMKKQHGQGKAQWKYLHASQLAVQGTAPLKKIITDILSHKGAQPQQIVIVIDQFDVLAEFYMNFCESLPQSLQKASSEGRRVELIAISNRPAMIGKEVLSYCKTRILIPPPTQQARCLILKQLMKDIPNNVQNDQVAEIAALTNSFTPADLSVLVKTAAHIPVITIMNAKSFKKIGEKYHPCQDDEGEVKHVALIQPEQLYIQKINKKDILMSLQQTKPSHSQQQFEEFQCMVKL